MIEKIVMDWLDSELTEPCRCEKPDNPPERYVLVEKTGSGEDNHVDSAVIAVQSYAESLYEAAALNMRVKAAMERIVTLGSIARCSLNSDYNFTDTTKKGYRYQAVYNITYYEED